MTEWIKKYWWVLLIAVVAITAPLVINWVILQPQKFEVVGDGTHWLGFWATYISAIASFAMVLITWLSLRQMRWQWEEQNRPLIMVEIVERDNVHCFALKNIGKQTANDIEIKIEDTFLDGIKRYLNVNETDTFVEVYQSQQQLFLESILNCRSNIQVGQTKLFPLVSFWEEESNKSALLLKCARTLKFYMTKNRFKVTFKYNSKFEQTEEVSFDDLIISPWGENKIEFK